MRKAMRNLKRSAYLLTSLNVSPSLPNPARASGPKEIGARAGLRSRSQRKIGAEKRAKKAAVTRYEARTEPSVAGVHGFQRSGRQTPRQTRPPTYPHANPIPETRPTSSSVVISGRKPL